MEDIKSLYAAFVKRLRDDEGKKIVGVLYGYDGDNMGLINVKNGVVLTNGTTITGDKAVAWVTGASAGAEVNESLTNTAYDDAVDVDIKYTKSQFEAAIKAGEFVFYADYGKARVLTDINSLTTFAGGRQITDNGKLLVHYETAQHEPCVLNTVHLSQPVTADSFKTRVSAKATKVKALVMDTLSYIPFTSRRDVELPVVDGVVQCDVEQDVLYIAQVERHGKNGNIGKAFMGGFRIRGGAMASSVGHDNHNIIVLGDSFEDMALAVNRCAELGGGQVIVRNGEIAAEVAYPVCGLLSDLSLDELADKKKELNRVAHEMGTEIAIPFMFLSFICLAAIPAYAITDCGFIDVVKQQVVDPILEVVE